MSADDLKDTFEKASAFVRGIAGKLESRDLLYLYSRFKQANEGPCNTSKPGFFDFQGKQKWTAWKDLGDMSKVVAMQEYISLLDNLVPDWRGQDPVEERGWVSVSTMGKSTDPYVSPDDKSVFDWVKESNVERIRSLLEGESDGINEKDESGLGLIHWAADRGSRDVVQLLLDLGADVDLRDEDQQTPLHYAASCGHSDVVKLLIEAGADVTLRDGDDLLPVDVADSEAIKSMFFQ